MKGVRAYQKVQVMTSGGVRLVVLLYEGVIKFNRLAARAVRDGDINGRSNYINRSAAIINELQGALDMERGGEIARNLRDLYAYCLVRLMEANMNNSAARIEEVTALFTELKRGWEAVAAGGTGGTKTGERTKQGAAREA